MDSKLHNDGEDDNELVFQSLTPEKPPNAIQKSILQMQDNWPPHWNKRHLFILFAVLSSILIFFLVFESIHITNQQNEKTTYNGELNTSPSSNANPTLNVTQILSYENVIYIIVTPISNTTGTLEALNTQTGKLVWSYTAHKAVEIKLVSNILYIRTNTNIVALQADSRALLWQIPILTDTWQINQGILFARSTKNIITALNATTGIQLWQTNQPGNSWQVNDGILYIATTSGSGLKVLDAHNGQQIWHNTSIDQDWVIDNDILYVQNNEKKTIQAYNGATGKIRWQFNTKGKDFNLSAHNRFLFLSNLGETQAEVIDGQTGKLLWQRQGIFNALIEIPDLAVVSSVQTNETNIIRTADGTILHHFSRSDALLTIENDIAFFLHFTQDTSIHHPSNNYIIDIEAVNINNGAPIWGGQSRIEFPLLQNNTIGIVPLSGDSLLLLRDDNGHPIWQHTFTGKD